MRKDEIIKSLEFRPDPSLQMKKDEIVGSRSLFYIIVFILVFASSLHAQLRIVGGFSPGNSGNINCNSANSDYNTIQSAINASNSGDEIVICPNTYNENILVNKNNLILRSSSGNRSDVIIQSNNASPTTTISRGKTIIRNLTITNNSANSSAIYSNSAIDSGLEFQNIAINSFGNGIFLNQAINSAGLVLQDSTIQSTLEAISLQSDINGLLSINDCIISGRTGLIVSGSTNTGFVIGNSSITSTGVSESQNAIYFRGAVNNRFEITNTTLNANRYGLFLRNFNTSAIIDGLYIESSSEGGIHFENALNRFEMKNSTIKSAKKALYFNASVNSGVVIEDSNIESQTGIHAFETINNGFVVRRSEIISTGVLPGQNSIYLQKAVNGGLVLERLQAKSNRYGVYTATVNSGISIVDSKITADSGALHALGSINGGTTINSSYFEGISEDAVRLNGSNINSQSSCYIANGIDKYALNITASGANSTFTQNCFYAGSTAYLARAQSSGNNFSSNYWDNTNGIYTQNNIVDNSPLANCPNDCGKLDVANLIIDYRFDECEWTGVIGEIEDSSGNERNASKIADANITENGFMNNSADFNSSGDYVQLDDASFINGLSEITVMTWVKNTAPLDDNDRGIFFTDTADNQDDRVGMRYDYDGYYGNENNVIKASIGTNNGGVSVETQGDVLKQNEWHHLTMTWKSGEGITVYSDGVRLNNSNERNFDRTGTIADATFLRIGYGAKSHLPDQDWLGNIDEFKIFDKKLSDSQIAKIYTDERDGFNYDGTQRLPVFCGIPAPVADYRFDECEWDGTSGEVKDSSENNLNGSIRGDTEVLIGEWINNSANINPSQASGYIEVPDNDLFDDTDKLTIMGWINPSTHNPINSNAMGIVSKRLSPSSQYAYGIFMGYASSECQRDKLCIDIGSENRFASNGTFPVDEWRHFAIVYEAGTVKIYIDGVLDKTQTGLPTTIQNTTAPLFIGNLPENSTLKPFRGKIDEIKIFQEALKDSQIEEIYTNESGKFNYDGTTREGVSCGFRQCFFDEFQRDSLGALWSIIKQERYIPNVNGNQLVLTSNAGNIATGVTLVGDFPSSDNLIEIEFDHYAYGGSGADGIVAVFSDASIAPVAGSYGGSLGYAQRNGLDGFAGGWLGFGFDEYGNFSNGNEGRNGGIGFRRDAFAIRGAGFLNAQNQWRNGYVYLGGTDSLDPGIDQSGAARGPGFRYKLKVDTRNNQTIVGVERDINDGNGYVTIISDINATQGATAPERFRFSLTGSTGGANNFHEIDNLAISALECGTLGKLDPGAPAEFDAWDTPLGEITNRRLVSRVSGRSRDILLWSVAEDGLSYQNFSGTLCARIINNSDNAPYNSWSRFEINNANTVIYPFSPNFTSREARVEMIWKKDDSSVTCTDLEADVDRGHGYSSDVFSIRPSGFTWSPSISTTLKASQPTQVLAISSIEAQNGNLYDGSASIEIAGDATIQPRPNCALTSITPTLSFNPEYATFSNGSQNNTLDMNLTMEDVGVWDMDLRVVDDSWTQSDRSSGDCESGSSSNNFINGRYGCNVERIVSVQATVEPYDLNITNVSITPTGDFRYIDSNLTQNMTIAFDAHALKYDGALAQNFDLQCYQSPVQMDDINFVISSDAPQQNVIYTFNGSLASSSSYNLTPNAPLYDFTLGASQNNQFVYNFERSVSSPVNPLHVESFSSSFSSGFASASLNQDTNTTFVYGRIRPLDTISVTNSVQTPVEIEVFNSGNSNFTDGMFEQSINWYRNKSHNGSIFGQIFSGVASLPDGSLPNASADVSVATGAINDGIQELTLTTSEPAPISRTIHLDISPWLWYSTQNRAYDASVGSTCKDHPCLNFQYDDFTNRSAIESGDFGGLDFNASDLNEDSGGARKRGIKVFR